MPLNKGTTHIIMDDQTNEVEEIVEVEEEQEEVEEISEPTDDVATLKARLAKLEEKAIAQRERTKMLRQELAKVKPKAEAPKTEKNTGELDETQLDYLDLKGISDDDEIAVIQKVMARTGQTVRQALKDDYVQSKLESIRKEKEVKSATPSSTKRTSVGQQNDLAMAVSKFEQSGILPDDFQLRTQVVNYIAEKNNSNKPRWH